MNPRTEIKKFYKPTEAIKNLISEITGLELRPDRRRKIPIVTGFRPRLIFKARVVSTDALQLQSIADAFNNGFERLQRNSLIEVAPEAFTEIETLCFQCRVLESKDGGFSLCFFKTKAGDNIPYNVFFLDKLYEQLQAVKKEMPQIGPALCRSTRVINPHSPFNREAYEAAVLEALNDFLGSTPDYPRILSLKCEHGFVKLKTLPLTDKTSFTCYGFEDKDVRQLNKEKSPYGTLPDTPNTIWLYEDAVARLLNNEIRTVLRYGR